MGKNVFEEKAIFVDLNNKEIKNIFSGDNIIRKVRLIDIIFIIISVLLLLLLINLFHYDLGDVIFFLNPI